MKKLLTLLSFILLAFTGFGQVPDAFNYQAVVRNSSGEVLANTNVSFRISILLNSATGTSAYVETQSATTNGFGLVNLKIGKGTKVSGSFTTDSWGTNSHFMKVEVDPAGGSVYNQLGTTELLSVPYAFHAQTVENNDDADADATNEIQTLSLNGTQLSLSKNGGTVTLPTSGGTTGDNWGTQTVVSDATLTGVGTTASPLSVVGDLTDNQTLSLSGNDLSISGGNTVTLPAGSVSPWTTSGSDIYYNSGKVGIGTVTPEEKLHISGGNIRLNNGYGYAISGSGSNAIFDTDGSEMRFINSSGGKINFYTSSTSSSSALSRMIITNEGQVAIGTLSPNSYGRFSIYGNNKNAWMTFNNDATGNTQNDGLIIGPTLDNSVAYIWNMENTPLIFATNNLQRMTIKGDGNVGIGTTSPNSNGKLTVYGGSDNAWISFNNDATGNAPTDGLVIGQLYNNSGVYFWNLENSFMKFSTNNNVRMTIAANGRVGIGTESPDAGLHLKGTGFPSAFMYIQSDAGQDAGIRLYEGSTAQWHIFNNSAAGGLDIYNTAGQVAIFAKQSNSYVGLGTTSPTQKLHVVGNAYKTEGGTSWATSSDIRLKNLTGKYDKGLNEIIQLEPVRYVYKKDNPRQLNSETEQVGFVAQEVQKIFPEAVSVGEDGYLDFNIHPINIAFVNAIKELKDENDVLKSKVDKLESRLEQLEALIEASAKK